MESEMVARLVVKLLQLLVSVYFVFAMFHAGSYWLFMAACLVVPLYGLYLMFRSPDRDRHRMPHIMFDAVHRTKSWLRVDATICLTMAAFFVLFAALLFYGYFKVIINRWAYIHGCVSAIILASLYLINSALSIRRIQKGKINFAITKELFSTSTSADSPIKRPAPNQHPSPMQQVHPAYPYSSDDDSIKDGDRSVYKSLKEELDASDHHYNSQSTLKVTDSSKNGTLGRLKTSASPPCHRMYNRNRTSPADPTTLIDEDNQMLSTFNQKFSESSLPRSVRNGTYKSRLDTLPQRAPFPTFVSKNLEEMRAQGVLVDGEPNRTKSKSLSQLHIEQNQSAVEDFLTSPFFYRNRVDMSFDGSEQSDDPVHYRTVHDDTRSSPSVVYISEDRNRHSQNSDYSTVTTSDDTLTEERQMLPQSILKTTAVTSIVQMNVFEESSSSSSTEPAPPIAASIDSPHREQEMMSKKGVLKSAISSKLKEKRGFDVVVSSHPRAHSTSGQFNERGVDVGATTPHQITEF
ncbi:hypothetical protein QR680_018249 [Steinernema hermaphroditum]|uniref:Uncharacterized protein n=1 Tax=Steinernema hermaphroditum TaxID=289476 RepID=A0AA39HJF2_9BILA|nr:hypothetical protein QR680_018249 [Steinernema hermaphroditum]